MLLFIVEKKPNVTMCVGPASIPLGPHPELSLQRIGHLFPFSSCLEPPSAARLRYSDALIVKNEAEPLTTLIR